MIAVAGAATGSERLSDALVGGGVTLVITVIVFPAAPLPLIQHAVEEVFSALHDTLARLAELTGTREAASPEWALGAGQRIERQLAGLQQARSTARQVASLAPRRWPDRARVRRADKETAPLDLLAATVLSLAHVGTARAAARQPHSTAFREALSELMSAFAALAEGGDTNSARAAAHAIRARILVTSGTQTGGSQSQLIASLVETCADDTLRLTAKTGNQVPSGSRLDGES